MKNETYASTGLKNVAAFQSGNYVSTICYYFDSFQLPQRTTRQKVILNNDVGDFLSSDGCVYFIYREAKCDNHALTVPKNHKLGQYDQAKKLRGCSHLIT